MPSQRTPAELLAAVKELEARCESIDSKDSLDAYVTLCCVGQGTLLELLEALAHDCEDCRMCRSGQHAAKKLQALAAVDAALGEAHA